MDGTRLVFINQLQDCPAGKKVRFLGYVTAYDDGILCLQDGLSMVECDLTAVLANVKIQPREWLDIVGRKCSDGKIDVLLVRSVVGIDLPKYRKTLQWRQEFASEWDSL
ncbi:nuclear telomere cap complex subunit Ten1 [Schizosaccharomyces cryophilus OY26]|uniref:Nuclear telomere cap complex subunit Ten1 n=1 Tax=Schizosaccharomyces cryophilus (strain OY26 / ATCC MYA-4695 / CBS 11777 / NBRC 106824 / NRRL Y48691) TaxID=653667 RepID=S9X7Y2_SCHCR|nr:nuclear telomere cap complex subunit Ten1 [Schizosaccharomyces cryophilus OY26]EPY49821.1 nuclear telomere cap complex subunit Ten1 [Schizosaccharomyces cryophilus OY26]